MKKIINFLSMFLIVSAVLGCSDDDVRNLNTDFSPEQLNGTWRVSFFSDENSDRTSEFSSYRFTFKLTSSTSGDITITSDGNTGDGKVNVSEDNVDGNNVWIVETIFENTINPGNADLNDLSEDWIVTLISDNATVIEFEEQFSNNKAETLHLEKL